MTILPPDSDFVYLQNVATNNLKNIDVRFPLGALTVVTGQSGAGKSSLVFDTLYGEAYRRYVENLSSFARQYLKVLPKPKVESIRNLPAAIAVRQARSGAASRSTVGTLTELNDILRTIFSRNSRIYCLKCGRLVERETGESVARKILETPEFKQDGTRILILAPLRLWTGVKARDLKSQLEGQGFSRLFSEGQVKRLDEVVAAKLSAAAIVIDRILVKPGCEKRLAEASALGMKAGRGFVDVLSENKEGQPLEFSAGLECCGVEYFEPSLALFSFNHPLGACAKCQGFGAATELNWQKIFPDLNSSLAEAGVAPWNFGRHDECYESAAKSAHSLKWVITEKKFLDYSPAEWDWLKYGKGSETNFDGIVGYFTWLDSKRYKPHYRIHAARFRSYVTCPDCGGARLVPQALACRISGKNISEVSCYSIDVINQWLKEQQEASLTGVDEALEEGFSRLGYLSKIGVGYLGLDRLSRTLSGGELQRINMARCLGSALTETLYCLDEPTAGLHPRDSANLLEVLMEMRDGGNTVVVVEHEQSIISAADWLIEVGPKAGHEGGYLEYAGAPLGRLKYISDSGEIKRNDFSSNFIEMRDVCTHNLKLVTVKFPVGALTAVCGVSGSGKTSLIQHSLYPLMSAVLGEQERETSLPPQLAGVSLGPASLIRGHGQVLLMSQGALGRSSRSNIATYLGIMDELRKMLAGVPEAKQLGLTAGSFSFNTPGGRCETCRGMGVVLEDLSFLGEMEVICPDCSGRRFGDDVLSVRYKNKNLTEILAMTASEARIFFFDRPSMNRIFDAVNDLGLGYVSLNQSTSSFSGGEAQRLKLVHVVLGIGKEKPSFLIFDEPTSGLSNADVARLMRHLRLLTSAGHTVVVVEHHLDVLRNADWLIEVGPEAAERGGEIVYQGAPEGLSGINRSVTRPHLFPAQ